MTRRKEQPALFRLSEAARLLSTSGSTLKQWIQRGRIRSVKTPGGHHRIPRSEVERLSGVRTSQGRLPDREALAAISGRNKLFGTITRIRYGGLLAEVTIAIGEQTLTAIITSASCRTLGLKTGMPAYGLVKATEVMIIRA
ncbi:MAG TPA: helix-turn-helix transcriptional regulator [Vicinamibacterales bacterium]